MPSSARLKKTIQMFQLILIILAIPALAKDPPGEGFFTTSDKVKLHYREAGQGEVILFIPGWLMPGDIWELQFQELSKDHHVIALDPRSQGQSDITQIGNDPLRRSKDIAELMDNLHLDSVVLVGWALGAFDCLAYLGQFGPDQLKALVLVDSPLAAASAPATHGTFLKLFETDRENANRNYVWGLFKKPTPKGFTKKLTASAARIPTDIAMAALDNTMPGEAWGPSMPTLRKVPLLYAITPKYATQAAYLLQVDSQARVETFETAGHALFVDEADLFNALLRDFAQKASLNPADENHGSPPVITRVVASTPSPIPATLTATPVTPLTLTPTPLPAATLTPTPEPNNPTATNTPTVTPLVSPRLSVTPTGSITPALTFSETASLTVQVTPSESTTEVPMRTRRLSPKTTETPSLSFTQKLSRTWDSFLGRSAKPTPRVTALPTEEPRIEAPHQTYLNASPVQDGYFTTSDHVRLHYLESGQGLAIVLIPGWLLPAEIWKPQLEGLSEDYHVIALDPRSQGESDMTPKGDEPIRQAKDIQELLDHLQLTSVVLVGWSHGGFQVLAYMGQFGTDRLYAAALVDSALAAASNTTSMAPRVRFLDQFQKDRKNATNSFVWGLFKKHPPADFFHRLTAAAGRTPTDIALALMNNAFPGDSYQPSLPTIRQIPLLYAVTPKYTTQGAYLQSVDPLARVEFFRESGHALFYDEADHFNDVMRDFLKHASIYPGGWAHPAPRPGAAPTPSYLENPK